MFCPNCGTQNPEAAQTCSKCGFHLKSVAAPKFKGTMLMMNQSVSTPPPPAPGQRLSSSVPPPGATAQRVGSGTAGAPPLGIPSKLKGTMVGVAPMAGPVRGGAAPVAVPPAGAPYLAGPAAPVAIPSNVEPGSAFSPPVPQAGVNPLGGTVAAENPSFPMPFGSPGAPSPYGAPPPGRFAPGTQLMPGVVPPGGAAAHSPYPPPAVGAPALPSPLPPRDEPGPPNPFGARPPNAYGPLPGYGTPTPQGAFAGPSTAPPAPLAAPYGAENAALSTSTPPNIVLRKRNALLTWLLPGLVMFGGVFLSVVLGLVVSPLLALVGLLVALAGGLWSFLLAIVMIGEVKSVTRNRQFSWFPALIVPFYNMYWTWILVPQEVARAKQLRGIQRPPQPIILYVFLWHFALASDLNDLAP